jgi:hypothetical protein
MSCPRIVVVFPSPEHISVSLGWSGARVVGCWLGTKGCGLWGSLVAGCWLRSTGCQVPFGKGGFAGCGEHGFAGCRLGSTGLPGAGWCSQRPGADGGSIVQLFRVSAAILPGWAPISSLSGVGVCQHGPADISAARGAKATVAVRVGSP